MSVSVLEVQNLNNYIAMQSDSTYVTVAKAPMTAYCAKTTSVEVRHYLLADLYCIYQVFNDGTDKELHKYGNLETCRRNFQGWCNTVKNDDAIWRSDG